MISYAIRKYHFDVDDTAVAFLDFDIKNLATLMYAAHLMICIRTAFHKDGGFGRGGADCGDAT